MVGINLPQIQMSLILCKTETAINPVLLFCFSTPSYPHYTNLEVNCFHWTVYRRTLCAVNKYSFKISGQIMSAYDPFIKVILINSGETVKCFNIVASAINRQCTDIQLSFLCVYLRTLLFSVHSRF